jgi:hypothetical protein
MHSSGRAGSYAQEQATAITRAWRRENWWPTLPAFALLGLLSLAAAAWLEHAAAWLSAGFMLGLAAMLVMVFFVFVPRSAYGWAMGADGETATRAALQPLLAEGWDVEDDVELGDEGGNLDHIVVGPRGTYLLETKFWTGRISLEGGTFYVRHPGEERSRKLARLGPVMRRRAKRVSAEIAGSSGVRQWVQPVVVVWGEFPQRLVEDRGVVYVHGGALLGWLRSQPEIVHPVEIVRTVER